MFQLCFSRKQTAEILGKSVKTIDELERRGKLKRLSEFGKPSFPITQIMNVMELGGTDRREVLQIIEQYARRGMNERTL